MSLNKVIHMKEFHQWIFRTVSEWKQASLDITLNKIKQIKRKQECISVGCVPTAEQTECEKITDTDMCSK